MDVQLVLNYGYRFVVSLNCVITQSEKLITSSVMNRGYQIFDHLIGHNLKTFGRIFFCNWVLFLQNIRVGVGYKLQSHFK